MASLRRKLRQPANTAPEASNVKATTGATNNFMTGSFKEKQGPLPHRDNITVPYAAQVLGLRTAFVMRPLEHGPGGTAKATGAWDIVATSIEDLADQLG